MYSAPETPSIFIRYCIYLVEIAVTTPCVSTQQTYNVAATSLQRRCNVVTLQRLCNDVVITLCVCWECALNFISRHPSLSTYTNTHARKWQIIVCNAATSTLHNAFVVLSVDDTRSLYYLEYTRFIFTILGTRCESTIKPCESAPCQNQGTCIDVGKGFECKCPITFAGVHCEYMSKNTSIS